MSVCEFTGQVFASAGATSWPSGEQTLLEPLAFTAPLVAAPLAGEWQLSDDNPADLSALPQLVGGAHIVVLHAYGGKVRARLTSTDGAQQSVPVDPIHVTISQSVPITGLDLTRVAGAGTVSVRVFLGQAAAA